MNTTTGYWEHRKLDTHIEKSGHSKWGFVIYRCTYASNEDWNTLMTKMKEQEPGEDSMGPRLRSTLTHTVFEGKDLDGASRDQVLARFKEWIATKPWETEQPPGSKRYSAPRYEICLMINEEALRSVLDQSEDMVEADANPGFVYALRARDPPPPQSDEEDDSDEEDEDWMRIAFDYLMIRWYELLRNSGWANEHKQHPDVAKG